MATLREIRRRISSIQSTQQITKAMKMVAAAKLRRAQEKIIATRPYAQKLNETIGHLIAKSENVSIPLLEKRQIEKLLIVVVTADRGLCGGFNNNLIRFAVNQINLNSDYEVQVYPVGKKAFEYFSKRDYTLFSHKTNFFNQLSFEDAKQIVSNIVDAYQKKNFDKIEIVYNEFKSAVRQIVQAEQFLPFVADEEILKEKSQVDFLYEPGKEEILNYIIPKQLNIQMWKILLESNAAEQGARMTAMENATENADELISYLTLHYNRARQAEITTEISEIVGGAEALKEQ